MNYMKIGRNYMKIDMNYIELLLMSDNYLNDSNFLLLIFEIFS